jgi:alkylated DNA repair dioxygenase AlkB
VRRNAALDLQPLVAHLAGVLPLVHSRIVRLSAGAYCELHEGFVPPRETGALFAALQREVPFAQRPILVFGREVMQPRLTAWIGDPEAVYRYSNVVHQPLPFGPTLARLRAEISAFTGVPFNSVLCNLYRDGEDAMGMHSDSEPELGPDPVIASLSLGAERRFVLRAQKPKDAPAHALSLGDGSLLVMRGSTQREFKHGVPRARGVPGPRINLTFRRVYPSAAGNR